MEFLVALIELRVLVLVVGMLNLPGGGHFTFLYGGVPTTKKKTFSLLQNFPLKTIPISVQSISYSRTVCNRFYSCKVHEKENKFGQINKTVKLDVSIAERITCSGENVPF